ncbi:MAG: cache domain-containing protein [Actinomycetes bacterium]
MSDRGPATASGSDHPPAEPVRSARWSSLSWRLAVLIIVLLATSAVVTAGFAATTVRSNTESMNNESTVNTHRSVAKIVDQARTDTNRYEQTTLATRKAFLQDLTNAQVSALDQLNGAAQRGEISLANAQEVGKQMLFDYRYGAGDYFFAFTPDMVSIVEPNPTFRGDMLDYRDPNGKAFFREFQQVALGPGSGYVDYVGTRVGASVPAPKVSYVTYYAPWQWVVGTGVYLDDIAAEAATRLTQAKQDLGISLERVRFASTGFFFVIDRQGAVVASPPGHGVSRIADTAWGRSLTRELIATAPKGGGIARVERSARFGRSTTGWQFGVSTAKSNDWILVSAVSADQLHRSADQLALQQVLVSLVVLVIGLAIGLLISRRIVRPVRDLTGAALALEEDRFDPEALDAASSRRDEVGGLARAFRRMAAEVVARERLLRERVSRLQVVIDHSKVADEITQITESDYFRNLERQAEELRKRD